MPYQVRRRRGKYLVVKKVDGKVLGTHGTLDAARRQLAALHANEDH